MLYIIHNGCICYIVVIYNGYIIHSCYIVCINYIHNGSNMLYIILYNILW